MFSVIILGFTIGVILLVMVAALWVFIALWPARMAQAKGYNFWLALLLSLFFWWAMFFVVLFLPNRNTQPPAEAEPL